MGNPVIVRVGSSIPDPVEIIRVTKLKIGDTPRRTEDFRFVTGRGCYVDDLCPADLAHAVVVRATHAYADLRAIDTADAVASPGCLAVLTGQDLDAAGAGEGLNLVAPDFKGPVRCKAPYQVFAQEITSLLGIVLSRAQEAVQDPVS